MIITINRCGIVLWIFLLGIFLIIGQQSVSAVNYFSTNRFSVGDKPKSAIIGDFDRDEILDIAVCNFNGDDVSILIGNGDGTFQPKVDYPVGVDPRSLTTGDFNQDKILDLAVCNSSDDDVSILIGFE